MPSLLTVRDSKSEMPLACENICDSLWRGGDSDWAAAAVGPSWSCTMAVLLKAPLPHSALPLGPAGTCAQAIRLSESAAFYTYTVCQGQLSHCAQVNEVLGHNDCRHLWGLFALHLRQTSPSPPSPRSLFCGVVPTGYDCIHDCIHGCVTDPSS